MSYSIKKKLNKSKKKIIAYTLLIVFLLYCLIYYLTVVSPFIKKLSEETVKAEAVDIINLSNERIQKLKAFYGNLFEFVKNESGDIVLIKSNTTLINQINMMASTEIQNNLNSIQNKDIGIPAGAFTGSVLLSKLGKDIKIRILSIGKCDTVFNSRFISVGINHALHRLTIDVFVYMDIVVPWQSKETIQVMYEILLAENVIVGKVPETYLAGENFESDYIDLIP